MAKRESGRQQEHKVESRPATSKITWDHDVIRKWAEERGAHPAVVRGTGRDGDPGLLRLDFPGYSGEESLEPIGWEEWFPQI